MTAVLGTLFPAEPRAKRASPHSPLTPELYGPARIVVGSLPDGFQAFTAKEIAEARKMFAEIATAREEVMPLTEAAIRKAYKASPGGLNDPSLESRIEQAAKIRSAVKHRMYETANRLGELLGPGMVRAANALKGTADDFAAAERSMADRLGVQYADGKVVLAIRSAEGLLRDSARSGGAGSARSLHVGTFGLIPE